MDLVEVKRQERFRLVALLAAWGAVLLAAIAAYWPGLSGPFLFDDFSNVSKLGDFGGVRNWDTFKAFVFGGTAGPTGRPLSLLTFLIDARDWPAESWPFKRTNLIIHIMNGVLLGLLISQILAVLDFDKDDARWIALISAGCWLLHPFLVSTTLYVVQRMAQLSTLFILAGLVVYVYGRTRIANNAIKAQLVMGLGLGVFTLLATISKENGILLPLLAGVVEITVFGNDKTKFRKLNPAWTTMFIIVPTAIVFLYLARRAAVSDFFTIVPPRDFSIFERLLTEPRILADYLQHWFIPKLYTTGVFQDHFVKSTGLFSPVSTALSILIHTAFVTVAFIRRRQWPLLALAVLFFYGGHVLESTVLNLELYFEHRNYLSACFLLLPLVALLRDKLNRRMFVVVAVFILALLGGFTRYSATIWESYDAMVTASAHKAPTSARAQARYAANLFNAGQVDASLQVLDRGIENSTSVKPLLLVNRLVLMCHLERLDLDEYHRVSGILADTYYDPRMINAYRELVLAIAEGRCPDIPTDVLAGTFASMLEVSPNSEPGSLGYAQIHYFIGFAHSYGGKASAAVAAFEASLESRPGASSAMKMAALLATNGHYAEAMSISLLALQQLESKGAAALRGPTVSESDIRAFRESVRADMASSQEIDRPDPDS